MSGFGKASHFDWLPLVTKSPRRRLSSLLRSEPPKVFSKDTLMSSEGMSQF